MEITGVKGDLYQTGVVTRYEILKYTRNKRLYLSIGLMVLMFLLFTAIGFLAEGGLTKDSKDLMSIYANGVMFLVILISTLMSAGALVSEFEDRTALIMFTRPVKKISIFTGKVVANFTITALIVAAYYGITTLFCLVWTGGVPSGILASFGFALLFGLATTGIALFFSAISKRSLIAAILTFFILLIMWMVVDNTLMVMKIEPVFTLTYAGIAIAAAISGATTQLITAEDMFGPNPPPEWADFAFYNYVPDMTMAIGVMLAWFVVTILLSFLLFRRREF